LLAAPGSQEKFNEVRRLLERLELVLLGGDDVAVEAARNYRRQRADQEAGHHPFLIKRLLCLWHAYHLVP